MTEYANLDGDLRNPFTGKIPETPTGEAEIDSTVSEPNTNVLDRLSPEGRHALLSDTDAGEDVTEAEREDEE